MFLLRTLLPQLGGVLCASILLGTLIFLQMEESVSWMQLIGVMQVLTLPFCIMTAAITGFLLRKTTPEHAYTTAFGFGVWLVLAPEIAAGVFPSASVLWGGYGLMATGLLIVTALANRLSLGEGASGFLRVPGVAGVFWMGTTFFLAGPDPSMGSLPSAAHQDAMGIPAAGPEAPNLALIVLDTLRADHLGCYGYERPTSPNLDRWAAEGGLYLHANSVATHTGPSHASMFTGMLPSEHGLMSAVSGMPTRMPTLAGVLSDAGYSTAGLTSNFVLRSRNGFDRGFHIYDDSLVLANGLGRAARYLADQSGVGLVYGSTALGANKDINHAFGHYTRRHGVDGDGTTANAVALVEEMGQEDRPFFLFANYMDAHTPYQAPGEHMDSFLEHDPGRFKKRSNNLVFQKRFDALQKEMENGEDRSEELGALIDRYDAEIAFMDAQLPPLMEKLQAVSDVQGRDLLVLIVSDHGEGFMEHGLLAHGKELWQECLHVPLIAWGSLAPKGKFTDDVSLIDLAATFTTAANLEPLGRSRDLLSGLERELGHLVAEEGPARSLSHFAEMHRLAVYDKGKKQLYTVDNEGEKLDPDGMYDLRVDPMEQAPLDEATRAAFLKRLGPWADQWWANYQLGRTMESGNELSDSDRAQLAALGYTADEE